MEPKIGESIPSSEASNGKRDAFHVPVVLVHSCHLMCGGDKVRFISPDEVVGVPKLSSDYDAIVDPFLITTGYGSFWVFVRPGTVSNLTHTWSSSQIASLSAPSPTEPSPLTKAEVEILRIVKENNLTTEEIKEITNDSCRGCYS